MLISTSADPPTVYVQNLTLRTQPISLLPTISSAAASVASFHPERPNVFVLAFDDGALAIYDASRLFRAGGTGEKRPGVASTGQGGEIGHLHQAHSSSMTDASLGAVVAAVFLPGFKTRIATLGLDGKCTVWDFEGLEKGKGHEIGSWNVRAPATSLAVMSYKHSMGDEGPHYQPAPSTLQPSPRANTLSLQQSKSCLIAVGRVDGKVLLYDTTGNLLSEKRIDEAGDRIIDLEWIAGPGDIKSRRERHANGDKLRARRRSCRTSIDGYDSPRASGDVLSVGKVGRGAATSKRTKRRSVGTVLATGRESTEEIITFPSQDEGREHGVREPSPSVRAASSSIESYDTAPEAQPSRQSVWQDVLERDEPNYLNLFSPIKASTDQNASSTSAAVKNQSKSDVPLEREVPRLGANVKNVVSSPQLWPGAAIAGSESLQPRAPKPTPRKAQKLFPRKSQWTHVQHVDGNDNLLADLRKLTQGETQRSSSGLALFAPYLQKATKVSPRPNADPSSIGGAGLAEKSSSLTDIWLAANDNLASLPARKASRNSCKTSSTGSHSRKTVSFEDVPAEDRPETASKNRASLREPQDSFSIREDGAALVQARDDASIAAGKERVAEPTRSADRFNLDSVRGLVQAEMGNLQASLQADMRAFQTGVLERFEARERRFEELLSTQMALNEGLRNENRRLLEQLAGKGQ